MYFARRVNDCAGTYETPIREMDRRALSKLFLLDDPHRATCSNHNMMAIVEMNAVDIKSYVTYYS